MKHNNYLERPVKAIGAVQFLSAFNANAFKVIVMLLGASLVDARSQAAFVSIAGALYVLPFIVLSPLAGRCADRFYKRDVMLAAKIAEIIVMLLGTAAFVSGNVIFICAVLFLMAVQGVFYGPAQFGILPELVGEEKLSQVNGFLQMAAFTAIIAGTACGGKIKELAGPDVWRGSLLFCLIAAVAGALLLLVERSGPFSARGEKLPAGIMFSPY